MIKLRIAIIFYGYSPERINPGDKSRTIDDVIKVTSGSNEDVANWIDYFMDQ